MKRACAILCLAVACAAADDAHSDLEAAQAALAGGDYAHALEQAEQAAGLFRSRHDPTGEKLALDIAGSAYLYRGDYDLALERYQTALQIDRRQQDASGEITRLCNIGSVYFFRGRYSEALAQYVQALKRVSETGASGQLVFTNLATLYQQLGDNQKALDYYQQALILGPNGDLLTNAGSLYRRVGNVAKSLESYHAAQTFYAQEHRAGAEVHVLEEIGVLQATDLHDLNGAVASFTQALTLAPARDQAIAHLFRGEALYRMGRQDAAAEDFRAAGDNWLALYRLGDIARAVSIRDTPLPPGFFPAKRDLYAAAIRQLLHAGNPDPQRIFALLERVHDSPVEAPPLSAIQARLAAGSLLIEHWTEQGETATLWATRDRAGITTDAGIPRLGNTQLLIVDDGAPLPEPSVVSYLPYASLLVRDDPRRTPLLPWRTVQTTVATKDVLYTAETPILIVNAPAVIDSHDPNRSHLTFSPSESLYLAEIRTLPLARTDLVILAGPDPDLVLSRAFLAAGARSVLSALRPIPQGVSLPAFFLRLLARGENKSTALAHAKLAQPEYASAFILSGDGQLPTRPVLSWWWVIAATFLAAGVIIVLLRR